MTYENTFTAPLWAKLTTDPILENWCGGLLTDAHRSDLIRASFAAASDATPETFIPAYESSRSGGLFHPKADFDSLISGNMAIKRRGPIYRKMLWALYRDSLDREATDLFWRIYYCHRKAPEFVDGKSKMVRHNYCRSMFCPTCRDRHQSQRRKLAMKLFARRPHHKLQFLTVLYDCPLRLNGIKALVGNFKKEVKQAFDRVDHLSPIRCLGAMELDLKHPWLFEVATIDGDTAHRTHCKQAFASMDIDLDSPTCPDRWWLLHYHALVDIGDNDIDGVKKVFKQTFPGAHRVRLSGLHEEDKTPKTESIQNLASYQLKSKLQYAENIYANDPTRPNKSRYGKEFAPEAMAEICKVFDDNGNIELVKYDYGRRRLKV
jgi:hypothetical protein